MASHLNFLTNRRRSVRRYAQEELSPEAIQDMLECALRAPTSKNNRGTFFVVVDNKATLLELSKAKPQGGKFVAEAPLAIAVCSDSERSTIPYIDCAIAASYIQLAATDNGLGSCWCQIEGREGSHSPSAEEEVKQILQLPKSSKVLCIIAIGELLQNSDIQERHLPLEWERVFIGTHEERTKTHEA